MMRSVLFYKNPEGVSSAQLCLIGLLDLIDRFNLLELAGCFSRLYFRGH